MKNKLPVTKKDILRLSLTQKQIMFWVFYGFILGAMFGIAIKTYFPWVVMKNNMKEQGQDNKRMLREDKIFWYFAGFITMVGIYTVASWIDFLLSLK